MCLVMVETLTYGRLEKGGLYEEPTIAKPGQETPLRKKPDLRTVPNLLLRSVNPFSKWVRSSCKYLLSTYSFPYTVLDTEIQGRMKKKL